MAVQPSARASLPSRAAELGAKPSGAGERAVWDPLHGLCCTQVGPVGSVAGVLARA
jgi:hypothetical protein